MPFPDHSAAQLTETSEGTTAQTPFHGTTYGNFRKIRHSQTTLRHSSRTLPQNRPPKRYLRHSSRKHPQAMPQMRTSRPDSWKHPRNRPQNRGCMPQPVAHLPICVKKSQIIFSPTLYANKRHTHLTPENEPISVSRQRRRVCQSRRADRQSPLSILLSPQFSPCCFSHSHCSYPMPFRLSSAHIPDSAAHFAFRVSTDAHTALTHAQHAEHVRFAITERELILIL